MKLESLKNEKFEKSTLSPSMMRIVKGGRTIITVIGSDFDFTDTVRYHCTGGMYDKTYSDGTVKMRSSMWVYFQHTIFNTMNISFLYIFFILIFSYSKANGEGVDCASEKSVNKFKSQIEIFYKEKEYESIKKLSLCYLEKFKSTNYIYESYLTSLYFTNDTNLLKIFLRDSILNKGSIEKIVVYLTNDNPLIIDLMDEKNFRRMLDNIIKEYFNNKPLANEKYFIYIAMIEDQAIRAKFLLKRQIYLAELDSINKIKIKEAAIKEFEELNKINNNKVYKFYKNHKRLFSQNEVNSAYIYQLLLFAHETKSERRLFYQSLLESAVEKEACTKEHLWNFLIRTKQIELSSEEFKNELPNIIEKLRNKYNIPEDFEYNGFLN